MAKLTQVEVGYSVGVKADMGGYENASAMFTESETYELEAGDDAEVVKAEARAALVERLDPLVEKFHTKHSRYAKEPDAD